METSKEVKVPLAIEMLSELIKDIFPNVAVDIRKKKDKNPAAIDGDYIYHYYIGIRPGTCIRITKPVSGNLSYGEDASIEIDQISMHGLWGKRKKIKLDSKVLYFGEIPIDQDSNADTPDVLCWDWKFIKTMLIESSSVGGQ